MALCPKVHDILSEAAVTELEGSALIIMD